MPAPILLMKNIILLTAFCCIVGCGALPPRQWPEPGVKYKMDMIVEVDGHVSEGMAVIPKKNSYWFEVESRGKLDMFTLQTCHREWSKEKAWNVKKKRILFWHKKVKEEKEVDFEYTPVKGLEDDGRCPIKLSAYEIGLGRHAWAYVEMGSPDFNTKATLSCNGVKNNFLGTSVCQSKIGLIQEIKFAKEMLVEPSESCAIGVNKSNVFQFEMKKDFCVYVFKEPNTKNYHKLTTYGYEQILIRR